MGAEWLSAKKRLMNLSSRFPLLSFSSSIPVHLMLFMLNVLRLCVCFLPKYVMHIYMYGICRCFTYQNFLLFLIAVLHVQGILVAFGIIKSEEPQLFVGLISFVDVKEQLFAIVSLICTYPLYFLFGVCPSQLFHLC